MTNYPKMATIKVGDELPTMHKRAEEAELFLYSAASFNPHRIHYDRAYATYAVSYTHLTLATKA